jgi:nitrogen regulatory protein PII
MEVGKISLITCIVQKGFKDSVVEAALKAGASGVTVTEARGTGVWQKIGEIGEYIQEEKIVINAVVTQKEKNKVFQALTEVGNLDKPGRGIAYIQPIEQVEGLVKK